MDNGQKRMLAGALAALAFSGQALAADWVMLQAMEPPTTTHKVFGIGQLSYTNYYGCDRMQGLVNPQNGSATTAHGLLNGAYNAMCRTGPELRDQKADFNLDNLAIGLRGNLIPGKINYFLMVNFGQNATTYEPLDSSRDRIAALTDATMTFSYIPGVRVRAGLMRKPGPEELYQWVGATPYIWPSDFIARVQLEKFVRTNTKGTNFIPGQGYSNASASYRGWGADAGRDWGIQFFDAFKVGKWTHTYAVMVGNGRTSRRSATTTARTSTSTSRPSTTCPAARGRPSTASRATSITSAARATSRSTPPATTAETSISPATASASRRSARSSAKGAASTASAST